MFHNLRIFTIVLCTPIALALSISGTLNSALADNSSLGSPLAMPLETTISISVASLVISILLCAALVWLERQMRAQKQATETSQKEFRTMFLESLDRVVRNSDYQTKLITDSYKNDLALAETKWEAKIDKLGKDILEVDDVLSRKSEIIVGSQAKHRADLKQSFETKVDDVLLTFSQQSKQADEATKLTLKNFENDYQTKITEIVASNQQQFFRVEKDAAREREFFLEALCAGLLSLLTEDIDARSNLLLGLLRSLASNELLMLLAERSAQLNLTPVLRLLSGSFRDNRLVQDIVPICSTWLERLIAEGRHELAAQVAVRIIASSHDFKPYTIELGPIYDKLASIVKEGSDKGMARKLDGQIRKLVSEAGKKIASSELASLLEIYDRIYPAEVAGECRRGLMLIVNSAEETSSTVLNAAINYINSGLFDQAMKVLEDGLSSSENQNFPAGIAAMSEALADLYIRQTRYADAEEIYHHLAERQENEANPAICQTNFNLGSVLSLQKKYDQAELMFKKTLESIERFQGYDHPELLPVLMQLASLYMSHQRYKEAEPLYKRILKIRNKTNGERSAESISALLNLGELYIVQGDFAEAEIFIKSAMEAATILFDPSDDRLAQVISEYAGVLSKLGKEEESQSLQKKAQASSKL